MNCDTDGGSSRTKLPIGNRRSYLPPGGADPFDLVGYDTNAVNQYAATANPAEAFDYDADGNLTQDDGYDYSWDSENRLVSVTAREPEAGSKKLVFAYDYLGRRVRKQVFDWDPTANGNEGAWETSPTTDLRFIYDGWNLLMELDGLNSNAVLRKYTWGLDLSSTPQGAGGVGGLVAALDTNGTPGTTADDKQYFYYCDAMGNVGHVLDATSGPLAAKYDYTDPFGGAAASGTWAAKNPFRFSTKYFDAEVDYAPDYNADAHGLYYYGYRYYSPRLGRWLSWDPMGESASLNLVRAFRSSPPNTIDPDGRTDSPNDPACCCCCPNQLLGMVSPGDDPYEAMVVGNFGITWQDINTPNRKGTVFTLTHVLQYHRVQSGERPGNCVLQWMEYSDQPDWYRETTHEWIDGFKDKRGSTSKVFDDWKKKLKNPPCPGKMAVSFTDDWTVNASEGWDKVLANQILHDTGRTSYIAVRVSAAPGCKCNLPDQTFYLKQILRPGWGPEFRGLVGIEGEQIGDVLVPPPF
ncbi:MAG: hypothetical protein HBSAPP02_23250 [Phycisphaerae bacterium]|nr:MAG: hypothetical protein HBSAPP02_23250 [Phycisphaerae bacterium]